MDIWKTEDLSFDQNSAIWCGIEFNQTADLRLFRPSGNPGCSLRGFILQNIDEAHSRSYLMIRHSSLPPLLLLYA